ncbi:TetR/AcrR family transcriptional regulator [Streptomyces murinus]|uniref:TetR/AcrR family transcriptional regulator n=1 Tax=Streptomyces murinus TaxID=33900 RepID=UPI003801F905
MARQNADQRREAVLRAAVTEFGRFGQDGASTTAIAQGAGISQGYLFRLFPGKRALFLAAVERAFQETEAALRSSADDSPTFPELRRRYEELVSSGDLLRLQLHVYSGALEDAECQEIARRGFVRLWRTVAELTRAPAAEVLDFFAHGMLLNVLTALGFPLPTGRDALSSSFETWAADSPVEPPGPRSA